MPDTVASTAASTATSTAAAPTAATIAEIEATLRLYLDGLHEGDAEKLAQAFHPCAALHSLAEDGSVTALPREAWLEAVKARPSPRSRGLERHDRIVAVDVAGDDTACAKLRCAIPPRFFTDFLLLLRTNQGWRIVQKAFRTEVRA